MLKYKTLLTRICTSFIKKKEDLRISVYIHISAKQEIQLNYIISLWLNS